MIENKIASSKLIVLDLEDFLPKKILTIDLKQFLFKELILKEKDFREALKSFDWANFENQYTAIYCSVDAVIPHWAYILPLVYLTPLKARCVVGNEATAMQHFLIENINHIENQHFTNEKVIIKGCGKEHIHSGAYTAIAQKLLPVVQSLMYGEPCSTVPIYKKI
ncbi:MAG: DUF2480 family protein [Chitinophagaceae bacterium]